MKAEDIERLGKQLKPLFEEFKMDVAYECYAQCLAVECGEGECAEAIRTKFGLEGYEDKKTTNN